MKDNDNVTNMTGWLEGRLVKQYGNECKEIEPAVGEEFLARTIDRIENPHLSAREVAEIVFTLFGMCFDIVEFEHDPQKAVSEFDIDRCRAIFDRLDKVLQEPA